MSARTDRNCGGATARVTEIRWDPGRRAYHGMVAFSGPSGLSMLRVSAPGRPGWDHARVTTLLTEAGRARGGDLSVRPTDLRG